MRKFLIFIFGLFLGSILSPIIAFLYALRFKPTQDFVKDVITTGVTRLMYGEDRRVDLRRKAAQWGGPITRPPHDRTASSSTDN